MRSKWGKAPEIIHTPTNVPPSYGSIVYYLRKRGTQFMDVLEPTEEDLQDKVEDLLFTLTNEDHIDALVFASTPTTAQQIISEFPEISELMLYGSLAGKALLERFTKAADEELAPLTYAIQSLGYVPALPDIAKKVATLADDGTISTQDHFLLSAFETLNTTYVANRKKQLISEAKKIK